MEDKELSLLKLGLALKNIMESSKSTTSLYTKNDVSSFRKFESNTGIRHATILKIVNGEKNAAWSTFNAILEGLEMSIADFSVFYDSITTEDILKYKKELQKKKQDRDKKKSETK